MSDNWDMTNAAKVTRRTPARDMDVELGIRAHTAMFAKKVLQYEVAAALGIGSDSLGRRLKGETKWALSEVVVLAETLNVSIAYLMGESTEMDYTDPTKGPTAANGGPSD